MDDTIKMAIDAIREDLHEVKEDVKHVQQSLNNGVKEAIARLEERNKAQEDTIKRLWFVMLTGGGVAGGTAAHYFGGMVF